MSKTGKTAKVDMVVVGSIGIDTIETPFGTAKEVLGGSVSYACAAASRFARVGVVGVVGEDFPSAARRLYTRLGFDLAGLQTRPGRTFRWHGVYDPDMVNRRTLSTELNVFADFAPELPAAYRAAPMILLGNIAPALQLHVLDQCRAPRFVVADTMDLWIRTARADLLKVIARVDLLALNDSEARLLTGLHNLRECAFAILKLGPRFVIIKKGEHGALLFSRRGLFAMPAYLVARVIDPTGAGDAFAGGMLGWLAARGAVTEGALRQAMVYGSLVASFAVEAFSLDRIGKLTRAQIAARRREFAAMLRIPG